MCQVGKEQNVDSDEESIRTLRWSRSLEPQCENNGAFVLFL